MAVRPIVSDAAEALYDFLGPWKRADVDSWQLLEFCEAGAMGLQPLWDVINDQDDAPGWSQVLDLDRAPVAWLPWLGQFVGVHYRAGLPETEQRLRIRETDGFKRGSVGAIQGAARQYLAGPDGTGSTATVYLIERHGSPYRYTVTTWASETPDSDAVLRALKEQKPGGLLMFHSVIVGGDFNTLRDTHLDFNEIAADFADFDAIRDDPSHT